MPGKTKVFFIHPKENSGHFSPPLGLAYLAAVAREKNCEIKTIDLSARYAEYSDKDILNSVDSFRPDIVCVSVNTLYASQALKMINLLADSPALKIAGGPHPTILPQESLERGFDVVVRGEGEETFAELIDFARGEKKLENILGISFRKGKKVIGNSARPPIENLDSLPFPAIDLFNEKDYAKSKRASSNFAVINSSRGCPYNCIFCATSLVQGKRFRFMSAGKVMKEIEEYRKRYGTEIFYFTDDSFSFNRERVMELCKLILNKNLKIKWHCATRVDKVDFELLKKMKNAGCGSITYGLESGNPKTLEKIRKGISLQQTRDALILTKNAGIAANANFILGFPWENAKDIKKTREFMSEISPYVSNFTPSYVLTPFPGSKLFEEYRSKNRFDGWWNSEEKKYFVESEEIPVFQKNFYHYPPILLDIFFTYPEEAKNEYGKTVDFIVSHNIKNSQGILQFSLSLSTYHISKILFSISPRLEINFFSAMRKIKNSAKI
ncbi:MAG: radical SAM protein [Candidatus Diapherotrites archaeon]